VVDVAVALVSYNTAEMTAQCVRTFHERVRGVSFELWLVDNGSTDDTVQRIRAEFPDVRIVRMGWNAGHTVATNLAAARSESRYVLWLNSDVFVSEGSVERLVEFMDAHPDMAACGCKQVDEAGEPMWVCGTVPRPIRRILVNLGVRSAELRGTRLDPDQYREPDYVVGAFVLVRRRALEDVGLMDEEYFLQSNEMDWQYRAWQEGWRVCYLPDARVVHLRGASSKSIRPAAAGELERGRYVFIRKHHGVLPAVLVGVSGLVGYALRYVLVGALPVPATGWRRRRREKLARYAAILRAYAHELRRPAGPTRSLLCPDPGPIPEELPQCGGAASR